MAFPTTSFEDSAADFPAWTPLAEEATFLAAVAAETSRVSVSELSTTAQGRSIWEARIGYPNAPTDQELKDKDCLFIIAAMHGNEPSGRESALQFIRDLGATADAGLIAYLTDHPVIVMPTTSPDARAANTRLNSFGRDPNHQFVDFMDAESRAMGSVLRDYRPAIVVDLHEKPNGSAIDVETLWPTIDEAHASIASLGSALNTFVRDDLTVAGYTNSNYSDGTKVARIVRNNTALRNRIALLVENYGQGATDGITSKAAAAASLRVLNTVVDWHIANEATIASTLVSVDAETVEDGQNLVAVIDPAINPGPAGYRLTEAQVATVSLQLDLMGLEVQDLWYGGYSFVSMAQETKRQAPFLLDALSDYNVVSGTRLDEFPSVTEILDAQEVTITATGSISFDPSIVGEVGPEIRASFLYVDSEGNATALGPTHVDGLLEEPAAAPAYPQMMMSPF